MSFQRKTFFFSQLRLIEKKIRRDLGTLDSALNNGGGDGDDPSKVKQEYLQVQRPESATINTAELVD